MRRSTIATLVLVLFGCAARPRAGSSAPIVLYVAPDGSDRWTGTASVHSSGDAGPFATLERARTEIRALKSRGLAARGVVVELQSGRYEITTPVVFDSNDSGSPSGRIEYRARAGADVRISGGVSVNGFAPVTDSSILQRLSSDAETSVLVATLPAQIVDPGSPKGGGVEAFFGDQPLTLARWPNQGFTFIHDVVGGSVINVRGVIGAYTDTFEYEGDRPQHWQGEPDVWVHGAWFWDWADERKHVASIDVASRTIRLDPPAHSMGYRKGQWYYAYNLLSELDSPGEWYLDRAHRLLYFWPPRPLASGTLVLSNAAQLIEVHGAHDLTFSGITFENARGDAITIDHSSDVSIERSKIRNVGGWAIKITKGTRDRVADCEITGTGQGGVLLDGGDRQTLLPGNNVAERNHIHHYSRWDRTYQQAIRLEGVGNRASHNLIHDAPHEAIEFSGNDHVIELNEIHHVCEETNDAGAIYAGRDWSMRGTSIRYNYIHDLQGFAGRGCKAVLLDDMLSGTEVRGNVFAHVPHAVFIGGGRDNSVVNNIFDDCNPAVHVDARGLNWASGAITTTMTPRLHAMPFTTSRWRERYPQLAHLLNDEPGVPKGNVIARNIFWRGRWDELIDGTQRLVRVDSNLLDRDPEFVDEHGGNFALRASSPAFAQGFERIPIDQIGLPH